MTTIESNEDNYKKCIVVLIDILGFKEFIKNKTCAEVVGFFSGIEKLVYSKESTKFVPPSLHKSMTFFSDTILLSIPLEYFYLSPPLFPLPKTYAIPNYLQIEICRIQIYALKYGLLTRGSISVGEIYNSGSNKWFGKALNEAHIYENKYAIFPRVILAPSAVELLKEIINVKKSRDNAFNLNEDGFYSIEYLSWLHIESNDSYAIEHKKVRELIELNLQNPSIPYEARIKWQWLEYYFNSHTNKFFGDKKLIA